MLLLCLEDVKAVRDRDRGQDRVPSLARHPSNDLHIGITRDHPTNDATAMFSAYIGGINTTGLTAREIDHLRTNSH